MTAVCPSESSPEGAGAGASTAGSRGTGAQATAGSISVSGAETGESNGDSVGGSAGGKAAGTGVQKYNRWSQQDSSDINTDDEGAAVRRLTPLERLNLDMCQDERYCRGQQVFRFWVDLSYFLFHSAESESRKWVNHLFFWQGCTRANSRQEDRLLQNSRGDRLWQLLPRQAGNSRPHQRYKP